MKKNIIFLSVLSFVLFGLQQAEAKGVMELKIGKGSMQQIRIAAYRTAENPVISMKKKIGTTVWTGTNREIKNYNQGGILGYIL